MPDTMSSLIVSGELDGYKDGAPSWPGGQLGQQVCDDATCDECGHKGLTYRPFVKGLGKYRAFAVCPNCHAAQEF